MYMYIYGVSLAKKYVRESIVHERIVLIAQD